MRRPDAFSVFFFSFLMSSGFGSFLFDDSKDARVRLSLSFFLLIQARTATTNEKRREIEKQKTVLSLHSPIPSTAIRCR